MTLLPRVQTGLYAGAFLILGFAFVIYALYAVNLMQFPFDYDQGEGFELVDSIMLARGESPYRSVEEFPFYASNYPPLYHVLAIPFVWAFGPEYWYGRLLSYLSTLVTASVISYTVWRETKHRPVAILAGLAFLSANTIYHIGPLFRQHISMVMFETLAVVALWRAFPKKDTRGIALGFFLLICAGYTKQLAAITAVAVILWLLLQNPRRAILWTIGFGLAGSAIFLWLTWITDGEWWRQTIVANVGGINAVQVFALFNLYWKLYGFLIVPAGLWVAYELYFSRISLINVWFVVSLILGGSASGTWGGGDSYFATSIAALCMASGFLLGRLANRTLTFPDNVYSRLLRPFARYAPTLFATAAVIVPLLYLGYGRATFKMPTEGAFAPLAQALNIQPNALGRFYDSAGYDVGGYAQIGHFTTAEDIANGFRIVDLIRSSDRRTLSEEAGFSLVAGREVITNPTQLLNLWRAGQFDGSALLEMINEREFAFIVLRARFYPDPVLIAIDTHYELDQIIPMNGFNYEILRPRD
ncbi:hypothetical protein CEN41_01570 [Fischerella thermalis CCMEE 5330]|uniref:Glycosyltransferase RgtA/B/C/D-like domain-containing protein n=1 Tax=Fischerella thermalis CCMEE 5330 TaxID=2019670 RepID=A0A2N6MNF8_9CYAN|nr:hypothetical protein CEN41_01570 [Fischerella thermalis CCMEE 5330]